MDTSTLLILLVLGVVLGAGGVMVGLTLARRGRGDESPLTAEALRPVLDELTRGAINEALGTSGMQLSEQLRSATEERLRTQQEATEAQSRAAQDVMRQLVEPLTKGVEKLDTQVRALEQARADAYGRLHEQVTATAVTLEALQTATGHLDRAMRSNQVRGQWGELQLQRIVELVGLKEHVSYEQQVQQVGTGTGRPDLTVHLTDGKVLYIDAKAPMAAFLRAIEEDDRDRQREHDQLVPRVAAPDALGERIDHRERGERLLDRRQREPSCRALQRGLALAPDAGVAQRDGHRRAVARHGQTVRRGRVRDRDDRFWPTCHSQILLLAIFQQMVQRF